MNKDNNFLLIGTIAEEPEKKTFEKFSLGTVIIKCPTTKKKGDGVEKAFLPITGYGDVCDVIMSLRVGDKVEAFGEIRSREWINPAGKEFTFFSFLAERIIIKES